MRKRQNEAEACCPTCGRKFAAPKRSPVGNLAKSTADMSTAELFAHFKATAALEDVRFYLHTVKGSPAVMAGLQALELSILNLKIPRADVYRQLWKLKAQWAGENYWRRVIVPAERRELRRLNAAARLGLSPAIENVA